MYIVLPADSNKGMHLSINDRSRHVDQVTAPPALREVMLLRGAAAGASDKPTLVGWNHLRLIKYFNLLTTF